MTQLHTSDTTNTTTSTVIYKEVVPFFQLFKDINPFRSEQTLCLPHQLRSSQSEKLTIHQEQPAHLHNRLLIPIIPSYPVR